MDKVLVAVLFVVVSIALVMGVWSWYVENVVEPIARRGGSLDALYIGRQSVSGKMVLSIKLVNTFRDNVTVTNITVYNNTVLYVMLDSENTTLPLGVSPGTHVLDIVVSTPTYLEQDILINYTTPYGDTGYIIIRARD